MEASVRPHWDGEAHRSLATVVAWVMLWVEEELRNVNSVESVTGIPAADAFLLHGSKSQVTYMNLYSLSEND